MSHPPLFRCDVPSAELLAALSLEPLPGALRSSPLERGFHRDIFVDTADGALESRGVVCRYRARLDDRRLLTLKISGTGAQPNQRYDARVTAVDLAEVLVGNSEPARRLRGLVDPQLLKPLVELETERRYRRGRTRRFARPQFEFFYDIVTVRGSGLVRSFQELKVSRIRRGGPSLEAIAGALLAEHSLRPVLITKVERGLGLLRSIEHEATSRNMDSRHHVTVIAVLDDRVAVYLQEGKVRLPAMAGSGEPAVRFLLRSHFGSGEGELHELDVAPATGTRPVLEVWLARRVPDDVLDDPARGLVWMSLEDMIRRVGSPAVRDPFTMAALAVAARSDLVPELASRASAARLPPGDAPRRAPAFEPRREQLDSEVSPQQFINGELSQLEFHARVLGLAEDPNVPLLERFRFLSIVSRNLDEFFMVRVGGLKRAIAEGIDGTSQDGLTPQEQLDAVAVRVRQLVARQSRCLLDVCLPALAQHGVRLLTWSDLDDPERKSLTDHFDRQIFPVLTPLAMTMSPGHPFPHIANLSLSLAVVVRDPATGPFHFARRPPSAGIPRFLSLREGSAFVPVEDVIRANVAMIYPDRHVEHAYAFRVTRSGDVDFDEEGAGDLLQAIEEEVKQRPFKEVVRVEVEREMPAIVRDLLRRELRFERGRESLHLSDNDIYDAPGCVDLGPFDEIAAVPRPELAYPPYHAGSPLADEPSIFDQLDVKDVLVHHPYDDFDRTVLRFLQEAARDPAVVAIKLTLYRTGRESSVADALLEAAAEGKEVSVFVEIKARFDEEPNIRWAKRLQDAGINVVYGLVRVKTHAKTALVVRRVGGALRRYVHVGTGNYNAATAKFYSDLGLLSSDDALGADLNDLFNELTGWSRPPQTPYRRLLVAPNHMRSRFLELVRREEAHAHEGRGGQIRLKLNGLSDAELIQALYRASQAGVEIDLVVRGLCTLRPGVPGLSERIRVISILGRFLEHARIYHFANADQPEYYLGSADWRPRNLRRRVEVVTPVTDPDCQTRLDDILRSELADPTAWELKPDGSYARRSDQPSGPASGPGAQQAFMDRGGMRSGVSDR